MNKLNYIHKAKWSHQKGYITTLEDVLGHFTSLWINWALNHNKIIWNKNEGGSYFEIDIKLWETLENQSEPTIDSIYNIIKLYE